MGALHPQGLVPESSINFWACPLMSHLSGNSSGNHTQQTGVLPECKSFHVKSRDDYWW
jgi:hypothetical protein